MNFQAVEQANGKNVTIWATMASWEGIAFSTNQAKYLSCKLTDDNGIEHKCRIYEGKGTLPGQEYLEKRMEFSLKCYQGNYQGKPYTGYSGFWSHGATKGSQNTPQAPQNAPQSTNAPKRGNNDVEIRKWVTCALLTWEKTPLVEDIEYWIKYIKTGVDASLPQNVNPKYEGDNRQAQDGDVPW